jgi:hypothetical protein
VVGVAPNPAGDTGRARGHKKATPTGTRRQYAIGFESVIHAHCDMGLKDANRSKIEVEDAIHNPHLTTPRFYLIIPHQHFLNICLLQESIFIVQKINERDSFPADSIQPLNVGKIIYKVGADAAFEFWIPSK